MVSLTKAEEAMLVRPGNFTANLELRDMALSKEVSDVLMKHYPGWLWGVEIPPKQGVIVVRNLDCDPWGKMGFVLKRAKVEGPQLAHAVMLAGGEFLERYNRSRGKWQVGA